STGHVGDTVVDLVPLDVLAERVADRPGEGLLAREPHAYGEESEPVDLTGARLDLVLDVFAEDLEATADAQHGPPLGGPACERRRESALPQPLQRLHRPPGPRYDDEVGVGQFLGPV